MQDNTFEEFRAILYPRKKRRRNVSIVKTILAKFPFSKEIFVEVRLLGGNNKNITFLC